VEGNYNARLWSITTPIAYVTSLPVDVFRSRRNGFPDPPNNNTATFDYNDRDTVTGGVGNPLTKFSVLYFTDEAAWVEWNDNNAAASWIMFSPGPRFQQLPFVQNFQDNPAGYPIVPHNVGMPASFRLTTTSYDPTNGTSSFGAIYRTNVGQK
jgi:hypothetical protein